LNVRNIEGTENPDSNKEKTLNVSLLMSRRVFSIISNFNIQNSVLQIFVGNTRTLKGSPFVSDTYTEIDSSGWERKSKKKQKKERIHGRTLR